MHVGHSQPTGAQKNFSTLHPAQNSSIRIFMVLENSNNKSLVSAADLHPRRSMCKAYCHQWHDLLFIFQLLQNSGARVASNSWGRYHLPISFSDPHHFTSTLQIAAIIIYPSTPFQIKELEIELASKQKHHEETENSAQEASKRSPSSTNDGHRTN